jgi:hypothetical protein
MSSTNRGAERNKDDYYYTPISTIQDFWRKFCEVEGKSIEDFNLIFDPCAGGDENRPCAYQTALKTFDYEPDDQIKDFRFWTNDIRENSKATYKKDYLTQRINGIYSLIISNPPFNLFENFVKKAIIELNINGYLIFLLRLNAVGGQKRQIEFWNKYKPKSIYIHSKRPCFIKGGSDSCEYAHFVWQNGFKGTTTFEWV